MDIYCQITQCCYKSKQKGTDVGVDCSEINIEGFSEEPSYESKKESECAIKERSIRSGHEYLLISNVHLENEELEKAIHSVEMARSFFKDGISGAMVQYCNEKIEQMKISLKEKESKRSGKISRFFNG